MYNSGLLLILLRNLHKVDFEGKKDAAQIFNNILRRQIGTRTPTVEYICTTPEILFTLCKGEYFMQMINFKEFSGVYILYIRLGRGERLILKKYVPLSYF